MMLNRGWFFTVKANLDCGGCWSFRDYLLFDGMVVVLDDLNLDFELVYLCLVQLLCILCQQEQIELDMASLHYLLSEFNGLLLSLLNNLPKFVRENINALVEFFLCLVVFSEVWVLI